MDRELSTIINYIRRKHLTMDEAFPLSLLKYGIDDALSNSNFGVMIGLYAISLIFMETVPKTTVDHGRSVCCLLLLK